MKARFFTIAVILLLAVLLGIVFLLYLFCSPLTGSANDFYYECMEKDITYEAELRTILKEKGKEDVYEYYLQPRLVDGVKKDGLWGKSVSWTKSEAEKWLGDLDNNTFTAKTYYLDLYCFRQSPKKIPDFIPVFCAKFTRAHYEIDGKEAFTAAEIRKQAQDIFKMAKTGSDGHGGLFTPDWKIPTSEERHLYMSLPTIASLKDA